MTALSMTSGLIFEGGVVVKVDIIPEFPWALGRVTRSCRARDSLMTQ
jgi:hypothetical protein